MRLLRRLAVRESIAPGVDPHRAFLAAEALALAARNSAVDVVRWICCEYCPNVVPISAMEEAATHGRQPVLQFLFKTFPTVNPTKQIASKAINANRVGVLSLLFTRLEDPASFISVAAYYGHLETMRRLYEEQCRLDGTQERRREARISN